MTSVTSELTLKRVDALMQVGGPTTTRAISFEPITAPIPFKRVMAGLPGSGIDWAILGGESDQGVRLGRAGELHERHAVDLAEQLVELRTPYFVKQLGTRFVGLRVLGKLTPAPEPAWIGSRLEDHHGGEWDEWGAVNRLLKVRRMPAWPKITSDQ